MTRKGEERRGITWVAREIFCLFVCLFIAVVLLEDLGIFESFKEISGESAKLQLLGHISMISGYVNQLNHQSEGSKTYTRQ